MHSSLRRGLAAACLLLCLAPAARALVISHSQSPVPFTIISGGGMPGSRIWSQAITMPGFDLSLGTLQSWTFTATFAGHASVYEPNPTGTPKPVAIGFAVSYGLASDRDSFAVSGPPNLIPALGFASLNVDFNLSYDFTFPAPLIEPATRTLTVWFEVPQQSLGGTNVNATMTAAMHYTYVPEGGPAAPLLALALAGVAAVHRRRAAVAPARMR